MVLGSLVNGFLGIILDNGHNVLKGEFLQLERADPFQILDASAGVLLLV